MPDRRPAPLVPGPHLRTIPEYVFWQLERRVAAARARGRSLVNLGIGSPDQRIPDAVRDVLRDDVDAPGIGGYPAFRGAAALREAAAGYLRDRLGAPGIDADREVIAVAGSKEGYAELVLALCGPGDVVLVPAVHYPVYVRAALLAGAEPVAVPMDTDGRLMLERIDAAPLARARVLVANYPCNPTTAVIDEAGLATLVAFAHRHDLLLVSDLAYAELAYDGYRPPSVLAVPGGREVAVELHSTSKSFNMAGLRSGFVAGRADAIAVLDAYRTNIGYGVSTLPQRASAYAWANAATIVPPIVAEYQARRDAVLGALRAGGWHVGTPRATMYVWSRVPEGFDDWTWVDACLEQAGVVITPGVAFGEAGAGWFRLSLVRDVETLTQASAALAAVRPVAATA